MMIPKTGVTSWP